MRVIILITAFLVALLSSSDTAWADESAPVAKPATENATTENAAEDRVICKTEGTTGSRLSARKTCAKQSDWEKQERQLREQLDRGKDRNRGNAVQG